ncbi:uncharacterized protein B0P05DRAFT_545778 [Gilbertella persicaria]|uniref:uncharacterized protein n=1 Tax=Gilbertella persicaria TaxID=101096 RepID=UPI0022208FCF|nr:uncharacterized protein B0P05DRAFT_545778 [Gilbertella persicaria]KAI8076411.1 hypothetical protein B0P05DRAFT_545778 [Gilbertella persicaria]
MSRSQFPCHWSICEHSFDTPEELFNHLSDEHVGRKATNNLCLKCQWNNCGTIAAKRDHLASHLRVHLPLKPHQCSVCNKGFKRPQDLKKHERIHTVEHQATLLSNQPGYKPIRRRKKQQPTKTETKNYKRMTLPSPKGSSEHLSDLSSSCSPSFSFKDPARFAENYFYDPFLETKDNYYPSGFLQDPIQDLIDDVLHNRFLPNYDSDMMERLNAIAPLIEHDEASHLKLPCELDAIPALQNWLEQLSANILEDNVVYPTMLSSIPSALSTPSFQQQQQSDSTRFMPDEEYNLYPTLSENNLSPLPPHKPYYNSTIFSTSSHQPETSASESSMANTPPSYEGFRLETPKNMKPQLWSPGYILSPLTSIPSASQRSFEKRPHYYTPSQPMDVTHSPQQNPELNTLGPHTVSNPKIEPASTTSFIDKKELVQMMNVFSSSQSDIEYKKKNQSSPKKSPERTPPASPLSTKSLPSVSSFQSNTSDAEFMCPSSNTEENKTIQSPYASLVDLVQNMKVEDEKLAKRRHAMVVNQLWKAISQYAY